MNVLIAGCGYVGSALATELAQAGHRVWGLRRSESPLPPGVTPVRADLADPTTLGSIDAAVDRLVYAASPGERSEAAYEDTYVRGLENVLEALARKNAPLARVVLTTSTAVYGQDGGEQVDESSPTEPESFSGRCLLRGEAVLAGGSFEGVALRLAGIYGPGRTWLIRRVQAGEVRVDPPGATPRYGNRIHLRDCAGALAHLLAAPEVEPVYVGVDDAPVPLADVYRFVAELLGVEPPPVGPSERGRGGNKRCDNARLRASGYDLRVPTYREGYPDIVRAYLEQS